MIAELPLFIFTLAAGLAAGSYTVSAAFRIKSKETVSWVFQLSCLILLAVGLVATIAHLQRPERILLALMHPGAMIAQEAYWSIGLGVFLLIDLLLVKIKGSSPIAINVLGAICSVVLMCVMGYAYFVSIGTPAWTSLATIPLFLIGDLAMGLAFWSLFDKKAPKNRAYVLSTFVVEALLLIAFVALAVHFASVEYNPVPFIVAAVIAPVGVSAVVYLDSRKDEPKYAALVFALAVIGVAIARYAFYAASIL